MSEIQGPQAWPATCTRCGHVRPWDRHPCPKCANPEYSLPRAAMAKPETSEAGARKSGSDVPAPAREPLRGQLDFFDAMEAHS